MENQPNIRHVALLGATGHGKATLTSSLVSSAGILSTKAAVERDEYVRCDSSEPVLEVKPVCNSMVFRYNQASFEVLQEMEQDREHEYLINLMDAPCGEDDLSADIMSVLRVTDGALVIIDCLEGMTTQVRTRRPLPLLLTSTCLPCRPAHCSGKP